MNNSKKLNELNLIDAFLFSASTENPEDAKLIAKIIIERATGKRIKEISVVPEKQLVGISIKQHGIRMDLYATEYEEDSVIKVYDIEPNKYDIKDLPQRSRYNQAITDVKLLGTGEPYKNLPEYISIWILDEDPFGQGRMVYTIKNSVEEDSQIVYNDGVTKLFLYVDGKIGGTAELQNLLTYFAKSDEENAVDTDIKKLHKIVKRVRNNQKVGEQYMTYLSYQEYAEFTAEQLANKKARKMATEMANEMAKQKVKDAGIMSLVRSYKKFGATDEAIVEAIMEEYKLSKDESVKYLTSNN